jgi:hypothetical protein
MRMAEVSTKFELSQDTLRYYERIGLLPPVNRNKSGIRDGTIRKKTFDGLNSLNVCETPVFQLKP